MCNHCEESPVLGESCGLNELASIWCSTQKENILPSLNREGFFFRKDRISTDFKYILPTQ